MHSIGYKETKLFSFFSKDKNLIHLQPKFAKRFFFKKPIVHGINALLFALNRYLNLRKKFIVIDNITINFRNYILLDELFKIKIVKNKIFVFNNINNKIEIEIKKSNFESNKKKSHLVYYHNKYLINVELIKHFLFISHIVGSKKPGSGSLIHKIHTVYNKKVRNKKKIKFKKIVKNFWSLNLTEGFFQSNVITSKITKYKKEKQCIKISKKTEKILYKKKILIIGSSGDIGYQLKKVFKKIQCLLFFYSFRVSETSPIFLRKDKENLKKLIIKVQPDYIFYLSSPNIYHGDEENRNLIKLYRITYSDVLFYLLKITQKFKINTKIFYPSSIFLGKKNQSKMKYLTAYIKGKKKGEIICKNKKFRKLVRYFRLPQLNTTSNYNIYGQYIGKNMSIISKCLEIFFNSK